MKAKKKKGPKKGTLSKEKTEKLKELFLQDGITPYRASIIVKCDHKTAGKYFEEFAEDLTTNESHEDWFEREKRVRARSLEGLSTQLQIIKTRLTKFSNILDKLLIQTKQPDHILIDQYERITRLNTNQVMELQQQFDAIEMTPPSEVIFEKEMEVRIAAKQGLVSKPTEE